MAFKSPLRGVQAWRRRQDLALGGAAATYADKVLGYGPIAYWPLWETSGTAAVCLVNSAQNGTYARDVSVMGTTTGIGDGNTAPLFTAGSDAINIQTATFAAAFNGSEGTVAAWGRVLNVGIWSDGQNRIIFNTVDSDDYQEYIQLRKTDTNNQRRWNYGAGGVTKQANDLVAPMNWFHMVFTWSASADEFIPYANGVPLGGGQNGLGVWAGTVDISGIGSYSPGALNQGWNGWIAHVIVFDRALSPTSILDLATV